MAIDLSALKANWSKKSTGSGNTGFWEQFYPFYKMDFDATATFRFLPDLDSENPLGFIVENVYHELTINGNKKKIACLRMYGEACPCCEESKTHYDQGDEKLGKEFWKKVDYIAQGVIVDSPFEYPVKPDENPVRLVSIGKKLYKAIENAIVKGDLDVMPYDMEKGYDFRINKTKQGEYADYSSSTFARKSTPIDPNLLERIELFDIKKFRFGKIERDQMETMIEAHMTGRTYAEPEAQEAPAPAPTGSATLDARLAEPKVVAPAASVLPAQAAAEPEKKLTPQDILARLKRQSQGG
jgi:hypothetical protein